MLVVKLTLKVAAAADMLKPRSKEDGEVNKDIRNNKPRSSPTSNTLLKSSNIIRQRLVDINILNSNINARPDLLDPPERPAFPANTERLDSQENKAARELVKLDRDTNRAADVSLAPQDHRVHPETTARQDLPDPMETAERPEPQEMALVQVLLGHLETLERPEIQEAQDNPDRRDKMELVRLQFPDRPVRVDRPDKPALPDNPINPVQLRFPDRPAHPALPDLPEVPEQTAALEPLETRELMAGMPLIVRVLLVGLRMLQSAAANSKADIVEWLAVVLPLVVSRPKASHFTVAFNTIK